MKYMAHRGYSLRYKDNSVDAIREAILRGYDGVEIDVQLCETGELVLHHDVYLGDDFVENMSLEKLRKFGVYTLKDIYDHVPDIRKTTLLIDIKGKDNSVIGALMEFYKTEPTRDIFFCSFNRKILYNLPHGFRKGSTFETTFQHVEYETITDRLDAVVLHWTCLDHSFISYCKMKNITIFTYTHKEDMELHYMNKFNIDYIITNGTT
jgi:glycerophosphoryl diester phosphodiesterase